MKNKLGRRLLITAVYLIIISAGLELLLQAGHFGLMLFDRSRPGEAVEISFQAEDDLRLMFIGDSWTTGAEASEGAGYEDVLVSLLKEQYPHKDVKMFNLAEGSYNSSQAIVSFLKNYKQIRPHILIALFGINNGWNTGAVDYAFDYLGSDLGMLDKDGWTGKISSADILSRSRLLRMLKIAGFNIFMKDRKEIEIHPAGGTAAGYFDVLNNNSEEAGLEYLLENWNRFDSYDDFYRMIIYHFGYKKDIAKSFLIKNGRWYPDRIKFRFDRKKHDFYITNSDKILEAQLVMLKKICEREDIILLLQTYPVPEYKNYADWCNFIRVIINKMAMMLSIHVVDHYNYFNARLKDDEWLQFMGKFHPNESGYAMMADNLFMYIQERGILEK